MRGDRTLKILLAMIVISLWALTLTQVGTPVAGAAELAQPLDETPTMGASRQGSPPGVKQTDPNPGVSREPTSTKPLRWRVAWATLETDQYQTYCGTAVIVTNVSNSTVNVDVEYLTDGGTSAGLVGDAVDAFESFTAITNAPATTVSVGPYWYDDDVVTSDFSGYAHVNADDPRIMVSAFQYCRSSLGYGDPVVPIVRSHTNIPAFPVGATTEFFQAGLPAVWTPPAAIVEERE